MMGFTVYETVLLLTLRPLVTVRVCDERPSEEMQTKLQSKPQLHLQHVHIYPAETLLFAALLTFPFFLWENLERTGFEQKLFYCLWGMDSKRKNKEKGNREGERFRQVCSVFEPFIFTSLFPSLKKKSWSQGDHQRELNYHNWYACTTVQESLQWWKNLSCCYTDSHCPWTEN